MSAACLAMVFQRSLEMLTMLCYDSERYTSKFRCAREEVSVYQKRWKSQVQVLVFVAKY